MKKANNRLSQIFSNVIKLIRKPVMSILPGQLSFFLLLSIIPIILLIGIICSLFSVSTIDILNTLEESLPASTSSLLTPLLSGKGMDYNIIILLISSILLISKGTRSIMRVASIIYNTNDKNNIKMILKSFLLAIMLVLLFAFLIIIPVLGSRILDILRNYKIVSNISDNLINIYNILKWPITIFVVFINIKFIYVLSPNKKITFKSVNKGAIFTTTFWIISTLLYSFYVTNISSYNIFYGGASNIIVLMLWVYLISYIFVLGMSINASSSQIQSDLQL